MGIELKSNMMENRVFLGIPKRLDSSS